LIVGCTHYSFILNEIKQVWNGKIFNPSEHIPDLFISQHYDDYYNCEKERRGTVNIIPTGSLENMKKSMSKINIDYEYKLVHSNVINIINKENNICHQQKESLL